MFVNNSEVEGYLQLIAREKIIRLKFIQIKKFSNWSFNFNIFFFIFPIFQAKSFLNQKLQKLYRLFFIRLQVIIHWYFQKNPLNIIGYYIDFNHPYRFENNTEYLNIARLHFRCFITIGFNFSVREKRLILNGLIFTLLLL